MGLSEDPSVHGNTDGADLRQSGTMKANTKISAFNFHNHDNTKVMWFIPAVNNNLIEGWTLVRMGVMI